MESGIRGRVGRERIIAGARLLAAGALLAGCTALAGEARGRTISVRSGQSVGAALAAAGGGDTVRVGPGAYDETIDLPPGAVLLGAGVGRTVLTRPTGQALVIRGGGFGTAVLRLTIRDASTGILVEGGSPLIADCRIEDCRFFGVSVSELSKAELRRVVLNENGTAVHVRSGSAPFIVDCKLRGNQLGLRVENASPMVAGSEINGNGIGVLVQGVCGLTLGDRPGLGNRIHRNRRANVRNETSVVVLARYNFWGDTRCAFVRGFQGAVLYRPFMDLALEDSLTVCP